MSNGQRCLIMIGLAFTVSAFFYGIRKGYTDSVKYKNEGPVFSPDNQNVQRLRSYGNKKVSESKFRKGRRNISVKAQAAKRKFVEAKR